VTCGDDVHFLKVGRFLKTANQGKYGEQ